MRVLILGGTGFLGPQIAERLEASGHDITVFHRSRTSPGSHRHFTEIYGDRNMLGESSHELRRVHPDVVVDVIAFTERHADSLVDVFRGYAGRLVVLSSGDVYRANQVQVVEDGEEALKFLRREAPHSAAPRPDLVLLDLNLPKVDGREVLATIKADANLRDIPVIVLTCSGSPSDVKDAYRHQIAGYIIKPAELDEYFTAIRSLKQLWFNVMTLPKTVRAKAFGA